MTPESIFEDDESEAEFMRLLDLPEDAAPELTTLLELAVDDAGDQALSDLDGFAYGVVKAFGDLTIEWKEPISISPHQRAFLRWELLKNSWLRCGAELSLARVGVRRAIQGFDRLDQLESVVFPRPIASRASQYLAEVSQCFLLGFDAPCIAFCGAALEQTLKDALVKKGSTTESELLARKPSGGEVLDWAKRELLVVATAVPASRIFHERDRAMHRHLWDDRIIRQMAAKAVADLTLVLEELATTAFAGE